jgi:hypothetical protein
MDNIVESECDDEGNNSKDENVGSEDEGNGIDCEEESSGY